jgi:acetolactate synthase-1/2/3 large subunit
MTYSNGGELLVAVLRAAGVDTVFGVISVHNLPLVEAVDGAMTFVPVRHEASAVNAADGYARARGGLGCALTSTGTGAGNAAGSLVEALTAGSSVLHITGQVPSGYLGQGRGFIHETKDQAAMLAAVSQTACTIGDADSAATVLEQAVASALSAPTGPASVEWPIDLQYAPCRRAEQGAPRMSAPVDVGPVEEAVTLLSGARRPVIWAGGGAARAGAPLTALVNLLGAGLFTSNAGRGAVPEDHPLCVGNYGTSPAGQALLDDADVLLSLGTHFRSNETHTYKLRLPLAHVQVDVDPAALSRVYPAKVGIVGDAAAALRRLVSCVDGSATEASWPGRVQETRATVRRDQRAALGPAHAALCDALRAALPRDAVIARDVTIASSSWGNRLLEVYDPRTNVFPRGGGIGQGLGMGLGAAIGRPDVPVAVLAGDGGLAVHLGELLTLAQERPSLTLVVFNDRGYGVLRNMQQSAGRDTAGVDLHTPDFGALAQGVGLPYSLVEDAAQAPDAFRAAVAAGGPHVVEVDVDAIGPMAQPFTPPVEVPLPVGGSR